jgi:peptidoglycan/xylan/chitin deacetylase (PgdA/CDA1 family)
MIGKILLTFDLEEFDVPLEYGNNIAFSEQIKIGTDGLLQLLPLIEKHKIRCTFFVTANYALQKPELIRLLAEKHEIASHGYFHSSFKNEDLKTSKEELEKISGQKISGFRMARLAAVDEDEIAKAGYLYNSSINPTWLPGRYNNLNKPRTLFYNKSLACIPTSVSPILRIPLFWLGFKNYPVWLFNYLMMRTLKHDKILSLYFHPWEFTPINNYNLPSYISKHSGEDMMKRLDNFIQELKKDNNVFVSISDYLKDK